MCGIAGVVGPLERAPESVAEARRMIETLAHRGPDGITVEAVGGVALAHARLSIIDLEGGWQPLTAAGSTIIGNGEIYNYVELTAEHGLADLLKTGSDFEPLLHLYAREGPAAFARLRGMYAFCLVGCDGRTWLVRDPFGIKPLYVAGDRFASEPRALGRVTLSPGQAAELLTLGYVLTSANRLPPGAQAPFPLDGGRAGVGGGSAEGDVKTREVPPESIHPRRALTPIPGPSPIEGEGSLKHLDAVLEDSVRVHQRSDVPYGLFLSGGIDSSVIATLMARLNTRPVVAYTCGFEAPGAADERAGAERVARALNLDWRATTFTEEDFHRIAPLIVAALDDPTTDYACLPTYKLAEAARDELTVVLSGEGGDELFAGYGRYRRALRPRWIGGRDAEPQIDAPFLKAKGKGLARLMPDLAKLPGAYHEPLMEWREAAVLGRPEGLTRLQQAQWADIATWLPNDLLLKLDRMLMAHGLEGRTPFLDREVAAFAWSLPDRMKVRGRHGKWILRRWLEHHCPAARPWAKKQGFTVPVASWIAPDAPAIGARVAAAEGVGDVCDLDAVRTVFDDPSASQSWWPLVFYALWRTIHIGGATPQEAGEAILGRR